MTNTFGAQDWKITAWDQKCSHGTLFSFADSFSKTEKQLDTGNKGTQFTHYGSQNPPPTPQSSVAELPQGSRAGQVPQ